MYERNKLQEARYFLSQMKDNYNYSDAFCYNLSAFLSASRSVLSLARNGVKRTENQKWYDAKMETSPIFKFFQEMRDMTVHIKPIQPNVNLNIQHTITARVTDIVVALKKVDNNGNVIEEYSSHKPPKKEEQNVNKEARRNKVERVYVFDFNGVEKQVVELCREYLKELELFIEEGISLGYISG